MKNKTQRKTHKYFFFHCFCFVFFHKNFIRRNTATNNTPKEVETFHYPFTNLLGNINCGQNVTQTTKKNVQVQTHFQIDEVSNEQDLLKKKKQEIDKFKPQINLLKKENARLKEINRNITNGLQK
jgi:small-conductance mechanosensitive channel